MKKMDVISRQVFFKNLKSKTWLWIVIGPLVLAAVFGGVFWLMNQTNQTSKIGVVTSSPALTSTLKAVMMINATSAIRQRQRPSARWLTKILMGS